MFQLLFAEIEYENTGCTADLDCVTVNAVCSASACRCANSRYYSVPADLCVNSK